MRYTHRVIQLLIGLLCSQFASDAQGQTVDRGTQRNGMHSCPAGQFVVGLHVGQNLLLCSADFGAFPAAGEIIDKSTQVQGMHACPEGMGMTGFHGGNNWLACAPLAQPIARFVDVGTQRSGMHACPPGNPMSGIHVGRNLLLCGTTGGFNMKEFVDAGTERNSMHSCPTGQFVVGVHVGKNLLLCSSEFGGYSAQEVVQAGSEENIATQSHGMHACPEGMGVTGIHVGRNLLTCAPMNRPPLPRFVDRGTQRSGMHACRAGSPVSGIHVGKNLLLCGTQYRLRILSFSAQPDQIKSGGTATLRWDVDCSAPDCHVKLGGGIKRSSLPLRSSERVTPKTTTNYTLTAESGGGSVSREQRVKVAPPGFGKVAFYNCHTDKRRVHLWLRDATDNTWSQKGSLQAQYSNGSCPVGSPLLISLPKEHLYQIVAVDPGAIGCEGRNDPKYLSCKRFTSQLIPGDPKGAVRLAHTIN